MALTERDFVHPGLLVTAAEDGRVLTAPRPAATNGTATGVARSLMVRTARVALDGNYAGFAATMRLNPRRTVVNQLTSGDIREVCAAVAALVVDWNYVDEAGADVPLTAEAIYDLPDDLTAATIAGYFAAVAEATAVPKT